MAALDIQRLVSQAASPHTQAAGGGMDVLAAAFHGAVAKRLRTAAAQDPAALALWQACPALLERAPGASTAWWQPELGCALWHATQGAPLAGTVQLLLARHAQGEPGRWQVQLAQPQRCSMAGHVFQLAGAVDLETDGATLTIGAHGAAALRLQRAHGRWHCAGGAPHPAWEYCPPHFLEQGALAGIYLQPWHGPEARCNADIRIDWPRRQARPAAGTLEPQAAALSQALALLHDAGTGYPAWIAAMLRGICVTPMVEADQHNSGSNIFHPGVVSCGFPVSAPLLAEALVHETSHQYFNLLHSVLPLVRPGADAPRYYSSLKRQYRPLFLVLLAFHATANMSLLWCDLLRQGAAAGCAGMLQDTLRHSRSLAAHLHGNPDLSAAGAALFAAQCQLLAARGHPL